MNVGARFSPLRTILLVSDVGRRQRNADFALSSAVSMALAAAPSIAWNSMRLPPQSTTAMATTSLFFSAHAVQASASARPPALEMIVMSLVTGTMLICDAWFDVMTASSRTDLLVSVGESVSPVTIRKAAAWLQEAMR